MLGVLGACHDVSTSVDAHVAAPLIDAAVEGSTDVDPDIVDAEADVHELMDHSVGLVEGAGEIVQANMADCDAMGDRLEAFRQSHLEAIAQVDIIYKAEHASEFERLKPEFHKRYRAAWSKVQPGIAKCHRMPKVKRVILEIWGDDVDGGLPP